MQSKCGFFYMVMALNINDFEDDFFFLLVVLSMTA